METPREDFRVDVAEGVEEHRCTDATSTGPEPAEEQGGEEDREPGRHGLRDDVQQGEEGGLQDQDGEGHLGPEDPAAGGPRVPEAGLHVAAEEGLFGERHQHHLRERERREVGRRDEAERPFEPEPGDVAGGEGREDQRRDPERDRELACGGSEPAPDHPCEVEEAERARFVAFGGGREQPPEVDAVAYEASAPLCEMDRTEEEDGAHGDRDEGLETGRGQPVGRQGARERRRAIGEQDFADGAAFDHAPAYRGPTGLAKVVSPLRLPGFRASVIPDKKISEIRDRTDIVALVGEYVPLKKSGVSWKGLCPFHSEKSPSFYVHPERRFFHCFGCGESGDVVKFLMKLEGLPFPEAVKRLAERSGVEIPSTDAAFDVEERRRKQRQDRLYGLMDAAAGYFVAQLGAHPLGKMAREELEKRGVRPETTETFRLGYAPDGWDGLATFLRQQGASMDEATELGLVAPRRGGQGHYDRFRHRLMFPISDVHGRIVAFSGRLLADAPGASRRPDQEPGAKYINSPESPLYKKGEILYGLHEGRVALRREGVAILCEGNFDLVMLHQAGFANSVAPMGTALTPEQSKLLRRFVERAVLLFDGDRAGRKAVLAAFPHLAGAGISAQVVSLPEGDDPDSFLRAQGAESLRTRVRSAPGIVPYLIDQAAADAGSDPQARAMGIASLGPVLLKVDNAIETRLYIERIGQKFAIADLEAVRRQLRAGVRGVPRERPAQAQNPSKDQAAAPLVPFEDPGLAGELVGACLDHPELLRSDDGKNLHDLLTRADLRAILQVSARMFETRGVIDATSLLEAERGNPAASWLGDRLATQKYDRAHAEQVLRDGIPRLAHQNIVTELPRLQERILDARRRGDEGQALFLTQEFVALSRNAHKLKTGSTSKR